MNAMLAPRERLSSQRFRLSCEVDTLLGSGGQGEVYRVHVDQGSGSRLYALKWYYPHAATDDQREILQALVAQEPPNAHFAWPLDIVSSANQRGFGYVMPLREDRFHGIVELMDRTVSPSFRTLIVTGLQLADGFWQLHAAGLCYRDISFGNVFFDPARGDVLICDNDNVGVDGRSNASVRGTNGFMAPEIMRGEAMPSIATDLYSLSVLLFYLLVIHHPLQGRRELDEACWDGPAQRRMYGDQPLFIFDPDDHSNEPVAGEHDNALTFWPLYPAFLRDLFTQAFTRGLRDPGERVRETYWRMELARLYDAIVYCSHCQAENFTHDDAGAPIRCWNCGRPVALPPRLVLNERSTGGGRTVMLNYGTKLLPHHLHMGTFDFDQPPVGEVVRHPQHHDIWGLRNLTAVPWTALTPDGSTAEVLPHRSVTLAPGTRVQFAAVEGVIRF